MRRGTPNREIMIVAGEASGDLHGATLARHLRHLMPSVSLSGMGGLRMAEAGVSLVSDVSRLAVVGTGEALGRVPGLYRAYRQLVSHLRARAPGAVVLIDFPEFNLRFARAAKRLGVPVVYFIPPQVWAWRRGRVRLIARRTSRVLVVFPFEVPLYQAAGARVEFVGHPVLDGLADALTTEEARAALGVTGRTLVGLLPGSRREEVERLLPEMAGAASLIRQARPGVEFLLALAPTVDRSLVSSILATSSAKISLVAESAQRVMAACDLLLVASGTATLEAAVIGTPMVVCYRVSRISEVVGRLLIRIPWISLVNIVAERAVVPELLQGDATRGRLAQEALRLLGSPEARDAQRTAFAGIRSRLGPAGVGERAARRVLDAAGFVDTAPVRGTRR